MRPQKKNRKTFMILAAVTIIAVSVIYIFSLQKDAENQSLESISIRFNKQGTLAFRSAETGDTLSTIDIEVANNEQLRARGLMYRNSLPENAGMLFIFDQEDMQGFWMKNTYIPLDMLFVNANRQIVTIHMNTTPLKEWNYASTAPAIYVVEVNAGFCLQHNIKEGDFIDFEY